MIWAAAALRRALWRRQHGQHTEGTRFTEEGDTLVEVLLAIMVLGIAATALLFGFATSITASAQHRNLATLDASVRNATDEAIAQVQRDQASAFGSCPNAYQPTWSPLVGNFTITKYSIQYWNTTSNTFSSNPTTNPCTNYGPQLWTLWISNGKITTTTSTVIYDPRAPTAGTFGAASHLVWLQSPTSGTVGSAVSPQPEIAVEDASNNIVASDFSSVTLQVFSGPSGGVLSNTCSGVESYGVIPFGDCSLNVAGTYVLKAIESNSGVSSANSTSFPVVAAPPAKLVFTNSAVSGTATNTPNLGPITVQSQDAFGNPTTTGVTVSLVSSSSGGVFSLVKNGPAVTTVTIPNGTSTVSFYYGDTVSGYPMITAAGNGLAPGTQVETVNPAATTSFRLPTPAGVTAGTQFNEPISVTDLYGNVTPNYNGNQCITFGGPASSPNGTSPTYPGSGGCPVGQSKVKFNGGVANASITLPDAQTNVALTVSATGVSAGVSGLFNVNPGTTTQLIFTQQPAGSVGEGTSFPTQPQVTAEDSYSNVSTGFASAVTLNIVAYTATNGGYTAGSLACTTSPVTAAGGVATFAGCNISGNAAAGTYAFSAASGGLTSGASNNVTIVAGAAKTLTATSGSGQSSVINSAFTNPVAATVTDTNGNGVSGVTVTFTGPTSGAGGVFASAGCTTNTPTSSCAIRTDASGVATSSTFTANGTTGTYNISASAAGLSTPTFSETNVGRPTVTNVVSRTDWTNNSATSGTFTTTAGDTYIVAAFANTHNAFGTPTVTIGGQNMTLIAGSTNAFGGDGGGNSVNCPNNYCYEWAWSFTATTSGTTSVQMSGLGGGNQGTSFDVLQVANANATTPIVQANTLSGCGQNGNGCTPTTTTASANLANPPAAGSVALEVIGSDKNIGGLTWSAGSVNLFSTNNGNDSLAVYDTSPAVQNDTASVNGWPNPKDWGTITLEIGT